jgi:hypothetical protein
MGAERSKKHHTVPQFLLRNFTDSSGILFEFDLDLLRRYRRTPAQVGHTRDFYTVETHSGPSDEVEHILQTIEDVAAGAVRKLKVPGATITSAEMDALVLLVAVQKQRTPAHRSNMIDFLDRTEDLARHIAKSEGLDPEEATAELRSQFEETRGKNFMNRFMLDSVKLVFSLMRPRGWGILRRQPDAPEFVISDNPVVITDLRPNTGPPYSPLIPFGEDSKITMPLSPDFMLISYFEKELSKEMYIPAELVEHANYQQLRNTERRLYGHSDDFQWGRLPSRILCWPDWIEDQLEARASL